jgi:hypothetical protein
MKIVITSEARDLLLAAHSKAGRSRQNKVLVMTIPLVLPALDSLWHVTMICNPQ